MIDNEIIKDLLKLKEEAEKQKNIFDEIDKKIDEIIKLINRLNNNIIRAGAIKTVIEELLCNSDLTVEEANIILDLIKIRMLLQVIQFSDTALFEILKKNKNEVGYV